MESDVLYHDDFATDHLKKAKTLARKVRAFLNEKSFDGLLVDGSFHSGCKLFCNKFDYTISDGGGEYATVDVPGDLFLIFDGGILYDFLSYAGDAEEEGFGWAWPLEQFCNKLGYNLEQINNYAIGLSKKSQ